MSRQKKKKTLLVLLHFTHTSWPLPSVPNSLSFQPSYLCLSASLAPANPLSLLLSFVCVVEYFSNDAPPTCKIITVLQRCRHVLVCHFDHIVGEINECGEWSWSDLQVSLPRAPPPTSLQDFHWRTKHHSSTQRTGVSHGKTDVGLYFSCLRYLPRRKKMRRGTLTQTQTALFKNVNVLKHI